MLATEVPPAQVIADRRDVGASTCLVRSATAATSSSAIAFSTASSSRHPMRTARESATSTAGRSSGSSPRRSNVSTITSPVARSYSPSISSAVSVARDGDGAVEVVRMRRPEAGDLARLPAPRRSRTTSACERRPRPRAEAPVEDEVGRRVRRRPQSRRPPLRRSRGRRRTIDRGRELGRRRRRSA